MQIYLRKRHIETQVYVGAFQYLLRKQKKHDRIRNEGYSKSDELDHLLILAKNLLCEIEAAIYNTGLKMSATLSREMMKQKLTFRSNKHDEVDDLDSKFAKVRFSEYLLGLQQILENRKGKMHRNLKHKKQRPIIPPILIDRTDATTLSPLSSAHEVKTIDGALFHQVLRNNDIETSVGGINKQRKNGPKDKRNRKGLNKHRRNQRKNHHKNPERPENVFGLRTDEMDRYRQRQHRRPILPIALSSTTVASA